MVPGKSNNQGGPISARRRGAATILLDWGYRKLISFKAPYEEIIGGDHKMVKPVKVLRYGRQGETISLIIPRKVIMNLQGQIETKAPLK